VAFAAAGAVAAALVIGLGAATWSLVKEKEARQFADDAQKNELRFRQAAEADRKKAQIEADRSRQVARYLKNILDDIAPSLAKGCNKKYAQEVLTRLDGRLAKELQDQQELEAMVRISLAEIQKGMGLFASAETNLNRVLAIRIALFGDVHPEVATALGKLAELFQGQQNWTNAEAQSRAALALWEQLSRDRPMNEDFRTELGHSHWRLGYVLAESDRREAASEVIRSALDIFEKAAREFPGNPYFRQEQAFTRRTLADLQNDLGRFDETERQYREAIGQYAALKVDVSTNWFYWAEQAYTTWMLATKLEHAGRLDAAAIEYRTALNLHQDALDKFPGEPDLRTRRDSVRDSLASLLWTQRKPGEIESLLRGGPVGLDPAGNLTSNGGFELPPQAGNGSIDSSTAGFGLPGWTVSACGSQNLILEYGHPLGRARFGDGRQAVLLNGDGCRPPLALAQTFTTTPGQDYILSFAQGDEEMAEPSSSELTVSIADESRVFSRAHDTGMVIHTVHFTASSNLTTLKFEDTSPSTPDVLHSPFLDGVSVVPGTLDALTTNKTALAAQLPANNPPCWPAEDPDKAVMALVGEAVPGSFKLPLMQGGEFELPTAAPKQVLLLDFCATWCGPCREATPVLAGIAKDFASRGVRYVLVDQGETPETIRRYLTKAGLEVFVALDKRSGADSGGWCVMAKAFQVEAIPTIIVVDKANIIRYAHVGTTPHYEKQLRLALEEVLKDQTASGKDESNQRLGDL